jgi:hypothetical protein
MRSCCRCRADQIIRQATQAMFGVHQGGTEGNQNQRSHAAGDGYAGTEAAIAERS